jgi:hypothetical protein
MLPTKVARSAVAETKCTEASIALREFIASVRRVVRAEIKQRRIASTGDERIGASPLTAYPKRSFETEGMSDEDIQDEYGLPVAEIMQLTEEQDNIMAYRQVA